VPGADRMTVYKLFIFNRHCSCIYYHEWNNRLSSTLSPPAAVTSSETPSNVSRLSHSNVQIASKSLSHGLDNQEEEIKSKEIEEDSKLVYGIVFSLKNIIKKLAEFHGYLALSTNVYKLHYYETPSCLRFVLLTDQSMNNLVDVLVELYNVYVEFVVKNPLEGTDPSKIQNLLFVSSIDKFIRSVPGFE
jgi:hypothetical protein